MRYEGIGSTYTQPADDSGHDVKDLRVTRSRNVAVVVTQNRIQQRRHKVRIDSLEVFRLAYERLHQLQNFFLDRSQLPDLRRLGGNES